MDIARPNPSVTTPRRAAFTLVELLVVITIIGILAGLITVAAVGALKRARQTAIKVELDQIAGAFETYKDRTTAYPPNLETDDTNFGNTAEPADAPISEADVLADLQRHMKQISPRHRESADLLRLLTGLDATDATRYPEPLPGGMTAGEAVVFWLSGFSSDPAYPISGEGGPSYEIPSEGDPDNYQLDPIDSRKWIYPFAVDRLGPRTADGYFDETQGRFVEFQDATGRWHRINFWQYMPPKSTQPYLYFDTSRHEAGVVDGNAVVGPFDPPAATELTGLGDNGEGLHVHAIKKINPVYNPNTAGTVSPIVFVNPDKFQVLHCGIDDEWGAEESFEQMSIHAVQSSDPDDYLLYPTGPFTADVADTIVNFTTGTLEDAQQ
jgi:prepilin-type N-terminal cleavage/methylation domain-containing protein